MVGLTSLSSLTYWPTIWVSFWEPREKGRYTPLSWPQLPFTNKSVVLWAFIRFFIIGPSTTGLLVKGSGWARVSPSVAIFHKPVSDAHSVSHKVSPLDCVWPACRKKRLVSDTAATGSLKTVTNRPRLFFLLSVDLRPFLGPWAAIRFHPAGRTLHSNHE